MDDFAELLERLITTPSRNGKLRLLTDYFHRTPDPDRGWAVAAITRDLEFKSAKPAMIRSLVETRVDATLFALSYDYVGDLAETASLIWPARHGANAAPSLDDVVDRLTAAARTDVPGILEVWFDALSPSARWALIKLLTGGLRIGVAARLVKIALAQFGDKPIEEIEELWHGLSPPYTDLFAWLAGVADKPTHAAKARFRPAMLAHPLEETDREKIDLNAVALEWKWDGIRVQAVCEDGVKRLYTRTGDDISHGFPDVVDSLTDDAALDGELLVFDPNQDAETELFAGIRPFNDLQQRLNRKTVSAKLLASHPAFVLAYDLLEEAGEDLRDRPFTERRERLEAFIARTDTRRLRISPLVEASTWEEVAQKRSAPPHPSIEGLMLKERASPFLAGRPKGRWWKWKRDPHLVDCVLMYAQRGHGKRSSFYSDYTFGVWTADADTPTLVPVGKAYHGFTDEELKQLDKFVRDHTTERYGPVRAVTATEKEGLVLEVAFEGLNESTRHKSGVAMRFPRIHRIRWDKPTAEADTLPMLKKLLPAGPKAASG